MKAIITHFKLDSKGEVLYSEGEGNHSKKPLTTTTITDFPLRFGYGSYNEPRKLLNIGLDESMILNIEAVAITVTIDPHDDKDFDKPESIHDR